MDYEISMALRYAPEYWATTDELEGLYEVSNLGRVRGLRPRSMREGREDGVFTVNPNKEGYKRTTLRNKENKKIARYVHRLVAEAFLGKSRLTIDHINCCRHDNNILNLRYMTASENARRGAVKCFGMKARYRTLNTTQVTAIKQLLREGKHTHSEIAQQFNVTKGAISGINTGRTWTHVA